MFTKVSIAVRLQPWRSAVQADSLKMKREDLFQEISNTMYQWPERERQIFFQSHYYGRSLEAISRAFEMDSKEVNRILKKCDQTLQISLSEYRKDSGVHPNTAPSKPACF